MLKQSIQFERLDKTHGAFQQEMFYESLFVIPGEPPYPKEIIQRPGLQKYWKDWGAPDDSGFLVRVDHEPAGAAWARYSSQTDPGYGFVSEEYPELGIALKESYRGKGIGTNLMHTLLKELKKQRIPGVSLSADVRNNAVNLYTRMGFNTVSQEGNSLIMLKTFS